MLLDELDFPGFGAADPRTGHIVVEVKTPDASELINYSCSSRVLALPTGLMNAHRFRHPSANELVVLPTHRVTERFESQEVAAASIQLGSLDSAERSTYVHKNLFCLIRS